MGAETSCGCGDRSPPQPQSLRTYVFTKNQTKRILAHFHRNSPEQLTDEEKKELYNVMRSEKPELLAETNLKNEEEFFASAFMPDRYHDKAA